jgi:DNA topoisomerase-3
MFLLFQDKSKLLNEATEMNGCVFCSPYFTPLVEKHRAVSRPAGTRAPRGRGGRGRTRGRPRPPKDKMAQLAAYFV